jgi:DNA-directed RNA polymerase subunit RPC12/RpoP
MSAGRIIGYIGAAILIFFGVLFIWATFSPQGSTGWLLVGLILVGIGFGLIWLASRGARSAPAQPGEVNLKIDLSGEVNLESFKCQSCGSPLSSENITMVAGAPVVNCPYCGTSYQLTEEPKW